MEGEDIQLNGESISLKEDQIEVEGDNASVKCDDLSFQGDQFSISRENDELKIETAPGRQIQAVLADADLQLRGECLNLKDDKIEVAGDSASVKRHDLSIQGNQLSIDKESDELKIATTSGRQIQAGLADMELQLRGERLHVADGEIKVEGDRVAAERGDLSVRGEQIFIVKESDHLKIDTSRGERVDAVSSMAIHQERVKTAATAACGQECCKEFALDSAHDLDGSDAISGYLGMFAGEQEKKWREHGKSQDRQVSIWRSAAERTDVGGGAPHQGKTIGDNVDRRNVVTNTKEGPVLHGETSLHKAPGRWPRQRVN